MVDIIILFPFIELIVLIFSNYILDLVDNYLKI